MLCWEAFGSEGRSPLSSALRTGTYRVTPASPLPATLLQRQLYLTNNLLPKSELRIRDVTTAGADNCYKYSLRVKFK